MTQKSAAPLTHNLLARKGQATAAAWRSEAGYKDSGPNVVALTNHGPSTESTPERSAPERSAPDQATATHPKAAAAGHKRVTPPRLLALVLAVAIAIAGGMAAYVVLTQPDIESPSPPVVNDVKAVPVISKPEVAIPVEPTDASPLQPAAGPETGAAQAPTALNSSVESVTVPPKKQEQLKAVAALEEKTRVEPEIPAAITAAVPAAVPAVPKVASPTISAPVERAPKIASKPKLAPPVPAPTPVPATVGPRYAAQFASLKTRAAAAREWSRLKARFSGLLAGFEPSIQRATVGRRGTFYRLRTADYRSRAVAQTLCKAMQAKRQSCLVIRR